MKALSLILCLWSVSTFAAEYKLDDPAILGEYVLIHPNKKSEIEKAYIRYNHDNQLVVNVDRNDGEYPLSEPDKGSDVVYSGEDEPNCDGDEPACYYDSKIEIELTSTVAKSRQHLPKLTLTITETNAFDDDDAGTTTTYELVWSKEIPDAIPFYVTAEPLTALARLNRECERVVKPTQYDGIGQAKDICAYEGNYKYRDAFGPAMADFLRNNSVRKDTKRTTPAALKKVFAQHITKIKNLKQKDLKVPKKDLVAQAKKVHEYILDSYKTFYTRKHSYGGDITVYAVNFEEQMITEFTINSGR